MTQYFTHAEYIEGKTDYRRIRPGAHQYQFAGTAVYELESKVSNTSKVQPKDLSERYQHEAAHLLLIEG